MANRSTFPNAIDSFLEHYEILASDIPNIERFDALIKKQNRSVAEENELSNLKSILKDKLIGSDDFNKLQDCIINMENFILNEIDDHMTTTITNADAAIDAKKQSIINYLDTTNVGSLRNDVGLLENLLTGDISNLVNAINWLKSNKAGVLSELSNVILTSLTDNDILGYDLLSGKWINQKPSQLGLLTTTGKASDSEKLDGLDSTQLLRSDTTGTLTGNLTVTGTLSSQGYSMPAIQTGYANLTLTNNDYNNVNIVFPKAFGNTPKVFASVNGQSTYFCSSSDVTTTGCRLYARRISTLAGSESFTVFWVAVW